MSSNRVLQFSAGVLLAAATALPAQAVVTPEGGFIAMIDRQSNFGDSRRSVVFYDTDDLTSPMFAVFTGWKTLGSSRSPDSIAIDPLSGDVYILATDRDAAVVVEIPSPGLNIPDNTEDDYDLLRINFASLYDDWVTNQASSYVTYSGDGNQHEAGQNPSSVTFRTDNGDPANAYDKIGEIARPTTYSPAEFFNTKLEFIEDGRLIMVDRPIAPIEDFSDTGGADNTANDIPANDSQVRLIQRVSTSPGLATDNNTLAPGPVSNATEGGFNQGTTESWKSIVLGQVLMDTATTSEAEDIAWYRDPVTGVQGIWIGESDGGVNTGNPVTNVGDNISFFEVTNFTGTAGNGLKLFDVGAGTSDGFVLDDNPTLPDPNGPTANNGAHTRVFIDGDDGSLVIIEDGFFDTIQDEPGVITRAITSYDDGSGDILLGTGKITPGAWGYTQLAVTGGIDDDTEVTDARWAVYDDVNNDVYFFDLDSSSDGSPLPIFNHDWYKLDLDTGITSVVGLNAEISTGLFGNDDALEFFCLGATCGTALLDGDYNGDGFVGIDDLNIVLVNWNQDVPVGHLLSGDGDSSGFIGVDDLNIVLVNWNNGTPPADGAAIPEPASLALFTMAGLSVLARRRSRAG